MNTTRVSLSASLKVFADEQVANRGFATRSAYIRELIRHDRDRQHLRSLMLEGGRSALSIIADATYFEGLRAGVSSHPRMREDP